VDDHYAIGRRQGHQDPNHGDGRKQWRHAYQSGFNYLSQAVGSAHPGYDPGWLGTWGAAGFAGGYLVGGVSDGLQNHLGVIASFADDGSGNGTFVLKTVHDQWSESGGRWMGGHTIFETTMGCVLFSALGNLDNTYNGGVVFPGRNQATVSQVNRAGFGGANSSYSKMQDIQVGDWLYASDTGPGNAERFVVLTSPVYNSATDITFWVLRTAGYTFLQPTYGGNILDETNGAGHVLASPLAHIRPPDGICGQAPMAGGPRLRLTYRAPRAG